MCTLIILNDLTGEWPLVFAANRDEFYGRPSAPPGFISTAPPVFAGRDLRAGGTWMGVTPTGFFAGLTNQRQGGLAAADRRSRGEVVVNVLRAGGRAAARRYLAGLDPRQYNPFNLVFGEVGDLEVVYAWDTIRFAVVPPGVHILPNDVLDSAAFPKVERARDLLADLPADGPGIVARLRATLADTTPPASLPSAPDSPFPDDLRHALHALCVRTPAYGTRSSSIVALRPSGVARYLFADGPPDVTPFVDVTGALYGGDRDR